MDLYHKRSRIIKDIFMKTYNDFIIVFTKWNDTYELILHTGLKIILYVKTKWTDIVEIMRQNCNKRKFSEITI